MILAIDIGNTTVTLGGVRTAPQQAYSLEFTARIDINHTWSASQYESAIEQLFEDKNLSPSDFRGVIISSVVPSVLTLLQECVRNLFGTEPLLVTSESDLGMTFSIPEPEKVGRDRLVDAAWAAAHYPLPVITVDLGTATTFNVVDENRVFRGGVICPGLSTGLRALGERCAQLPQVHLGSPARPPDPETHHWQKHRRMHSLRHHRRHGRDARRNGPAHRSRTRLPRHPHPHRRRGTLRRTARFTSSYL